MSSYSLKIFNEVAEGYPDCFTRLGNKSVISVELSQRLASAARLRNLLTHRYWDIVGEEVYASAKKGLSDFIEFIDYIKRFLEVSL